MFDNNESFTEVLKGFMNGDVNPTVNVALDKETLIYMFAGVLSLILISILFQKFLKNKLGV